MDRIMDTVCGIAFITLALGIVALIVGAVIATVMGC